MLWSDNCLIPKGAKNAYTAQVMIDFCYDPTIAAQIEAAVNYICPVKGAAEVLLAKNPDIANNPLIFPPADVLARLHIFNGLDEATEKYFNDQFATVTGLVNASIVADRVRAERGAWAVFCDGTNGSSRMLLLAPGLLWLVFFYVLPGLQMLLTSFWSGTLETGYEFALSNISNYSDALVKYSAQFVPLDPVRRRWRPC